MKLLCLIGNSATMVSVNHPGALRHPSTGGEFSMVPISFPSCEVDITMLPTPFPSCGGVPLTSGGVVFHTFAQIAKFHAFLRQLIFWCELKCGNLAVSFSVTAYEYFDYGWFGDWYWYIQFRLIYAGIVYL